MAFQIIRNDITKVSADAIVNTANPKPTYASGTDAAIYMAAGAEELLEERRKIGDIDVGEAAFTPAFKLDAKYIIHTVGPAWIDGDHGEREAVKSCYENSLKLAKELECESIAFPLIATGVYGFPKDEALQIAVSVFSSFLSATDMEIILVVFDPESFVLSGRIFSDVDSFIDENYVSEQTEAEYSSVLLEEESPMPDSSPVFFGRAAFPVGAGFAEARKPKGKDGPKKSKRKADGKAPASASLNRVFSCDEAVADECMTPERPLKLSSAVSMRTLEDAVANLGESFQDMLFRLIDERGYKDSEVYKRANIDRKLFSKIRSNADYKPGKKTVMALALALRLNLDETKDFIGRAGYALSPGNVSDLIIEYFIENEVYDIYQINLALFDHGQDCLGS